MNVSTNLRVHVVFNDFGEENEITLVLSKFDQVSDLKEEICNKFGIAPRSQLIENWAVEPRDDDDLIGICCPYSDNYLVLHDSNITPVHNSSSQNDNSLPRNDVQEDDKEELASLHFVQHFTNNYETTDILFHVCRLKDAFDLACFTPLRERKIVLLFLNNPQEKFSKIFGENVIKPEVKEILNDKFFLLGWDVEKEEFHPALKRALEDYCELLHVSNLIDKKTCAALMIVPIKDSISLFACMRGKVSEKNFLDYFKKAVDFLQAENSIEDSLNDQGDAEVDLGSVKFQQMMLDMLGDRDYDNFDYFEFEQLKEKIAYALYGPPQKETGYDEKQNKKIDFLFKIIVEQNNNFAKYKDRVIISFIYNCLEPLPEEKVKRAKKFPDYNPNTDLTPVPLFILRKCKKSENPCRLIIDDTGRVYSSWQSYLTQNKLSECEMILPFNGRYEADSNGRVKIEKHLSPACGLDVKILQGVDIASTAVGLASGGIFIAAAIPAIAVAPAALVVAGATGLGVGLYSLGRSAFTLYDRKKHRETLSFANSEARGAYLNIVAGSLGFVGAGANMAVSQLAARGMNIGQGATAAVNVINVANITASGVSVGNSGYDVFDQWYNDNQTPSFLTILQLSSSILFFGHAVYNFKGAATIVEESRSNTLRDYNDSLRSNRHRRTFNKLVKATIANNNGDVSRGHAEVIKTIRNISNKDEVFAALTRANKDMNQNNVRFSADGGNIHLNGVSIDMQQFVKMDKPEVVTFLRQVPSRVEPPANDVKAISKSINKSISSGANLSVREIYTVAVGIATLFRGDIDTKEKIINTITTVTSRLVQDSPDILSELDRIFPHLSKLMKIFNMVTQFLQSKVDEIEEQYQKWLVGKDASLVKSYFPELPSDFAQRAVKIFNIVCQVYYTGVFPTETAVKKIVEFFYAWFTKQCIDYETSQERKRKRNEHSASPSRKVTCPDCGGHYYRA